jgi:Na+/proline symporter
MIGASLSGVTFISIPGVVGAEGLNKSFSYMQMVYGYLVGYLVIATVLMPIYYKLNLTTIYGYLEQRFGVVSYKTGAAFFQLSRIVGASFRLYLIAIVLHRFIMEIWGIPFWMTVAVTILLIWIYTFRGGIKTIVWTDVFQTVSMIAAVVITIILFSKQLDASIPELINRVKESDYSQMFFFKSGWSDPNNFFKQFISGALIALVMTGLDQDMMQKNLTCRNLKDAQKNMLVFSVILVFVNLLFLTLGALLYIYAAEFEILIPKKTDYLYPTISLQYLPPIAGIVFILGLVAAAYSSADSALTSLTTSFCIDFLGFNKMDESQGAKSKRTRMIVHISFSILLFIMILIFWNVNNDAVITSLFKFAGYTYGPILGLFVFGIISKRKVLDRLVIIVCLIAPLLTWLIDANSDKIFGGLSLGYLILAVNGILTFLGLFLISRKTKV